MELDPRLREGDGYDDRNSNRDEHDGHRESDAAAGRPATGIASSSTTTTPSSQLSSQLTNPTSAYPPLPSLSFAQDDAVGSDANGPDPRHFQSQQQHHQHDEQAGLDADGNDPKKSRACEACRGLKVRCEPAPDDEGPCKRCKKAGRNCVVTVPTRKRQKKTDSRVAELEKKIDALTASLQSRTGSYGNSHVDAVPASAPPPPSAAGPVMVSPHRASVSSPTVTRRHTAETSGGYGMGWGNGTSRHWSIPPPGQERSEYLHRQTGLAREQTPTQSQASPLPPLPPMMAGQKRKVSERQDTLEDDHRDSSAPESSLFKAYEGDVVERGVITMDKAAELFTRYNDHMVRHFPAVVFPPSMTASELRTTKPTLFLSIMASASGEHHSVQKVLHQDLMKLLAEKVLIRGEKNMELVQAIQVAAIWYWPPEHFEELKFYQLIHIAAVMALDIGLGTKTPPRRLIPAFIPQQQNSPFARHSPPDPTSLECRRAWLTCHFLTSAAAMHMQRPFLIRWSRFMSECLDILSTSPDAAPTDQYFCHLVRSHRLVEDIGSQLSTDDATVALNITDARTKYTMRALERDLESCRAAVPQDLMLPALKMSFNVISIYMHEMAMQEHMGMDELRPPYNAESLGNHLAISEPLSAAHVNSLSVTLTAIDEVLHTFLSLEVATIRCLPQYNFVRVAYSLVILLKMYFSALSPNSELGKVINIENIRVDYYLDALLQKFQDTAANDRCRPAAKFLVVVAMLRNWFLKQGKADDVRQGPPSSANSKANATPDHSRSGPLPQTSSTATADQTPLQQHQQQQQSPTEANTPLHLLSEVATGRDSTPARGLFQSMSGNRLGQTPQPYFHNANTATSMPPQGLSLATSGAGPTLAFDADLTAAMAPAVPSSWVSQPDAADLNMAGAAPGFDLDGFGGLVGGQGVYEDGARMVMNEPWFMEMFHGISGPSTFPF